ncbi:Alpha/Beta hydrolase protein [Podospora australis]|uniref:Alpha/Beta hydrolase protein n=1 Tax=Podospora australis TaxID=1536484 RepID=A0AAN6WZT2_9PEZI|nr:Alpha/Beta hydrolase protein [Podospora australis]
MRFWRQLGLTNIVTHQTECGYAEGPEYTGTHPDFTPLPKHGHLSIPSPNFLTVQEHIDAAFQRYWDAPDFPAIRAMVPKVDAVIPPGGPDRSKDVVTELISFPARDGHLLELKVYKSPEVQPDAVLVYRLHGGGWTIGDHESDGAENVHAAANKNIVAVSVDYRLAPEHPFPTPLNDCFDGLLFFKENAQKLGINVEKIIIGGSSAGANLHLVLEAWDNNVTGIIGQVLSFPAVCHPKFFPRDKYEFGSWIQNENIFKTFTPSCRIFERTTTNFGLDVLRDDSFAYTEALQAAGVEVELFAYGGLPHCFPGFLFDLEGTREFYDKYNAFLCKLSNARS